MSRPASPWGAWATGLRARPRAEACGAAAALEEMGVSAVWMTGGTGDPFGRIAALLEATGTVTVATGILSIWELTPAQLAARLTALPAAGRSRFLLGLGVSHQQLVDHRTPGRYDRPLTRMREFLDELDRTGAPGSHPQERVLAALGPRMLDLAAKRAAGAHPYLTTPAHTRAARSCLGEAFLAPTQMALLLPHPGPARQAARRYLAPYLAQPNYRNSWLRQGFTPADLDDGGSDRLVDALVAWGDPAQVVRRAGAHLDAGADHVCIQLLDPEGSWSDHAIPLDAWRELAGALTI
ncbi:TIGR03620 family F420-dependent LLM class oxidoreductase [Dactylosporangium sp. CA-139066]|uniref:TIGR03620 family F420-dependent LLM class oxidoreductase n=1 Tax=Dactylosporangium sp. CA-139066 TaxID=3239930 RepID=UPI003D919136